MTNEEPTPSPEPAPTANPGSASNVPGQAPEEAGTSALRVVINGVAVLATAGTMGPIGLLFLGGMPKSIGDWAFPVFWIIFIPVALYAAFTPHQTRGPLFTLGVCGVALLNVCGCVQALQGIGRATG